MSRIEEAKPQSVLTKRDLWMAWFRWMMFCEMSNSYERLQTLSFCNAIAPILAKLYKKKEDLVEALKRHLVFFNTNGTWGAIIHGTVIAMEEEKARGADIPAEAIIGLKTGLMGPFAGIGDTMGGGAISPIILSLMLPSAMAGHWWGAFGNWFIAGMINMYIMATMWFSGYRLGKRSILQVLEGGWIQQLIAGAGCMGLFMMGSLAASFVKLSTRLAFTAGEATASQSFQVQALLDKLIPGVLPLTVVFGIYFYLVKRGPKYTKILLTLVSISIIGSLLGVF